MRTKIQKGLKALTIDKKLTAYLESLSRIELTDEERKKNENDLQNILSYIETLNELSTDGVEPLSHSFPVANVMRTDEVQMHNTRDDILMNAPEKKDGCFVVPKTVE